MWLGRDVRGNGSETKLRLCSSHGRPCTPGKLPRGRWRPYYVLPSGNSQVVRFSRRLARALAAALDANSSYGHHQFLTGVFCEREAWGCAHTALNNSFVKWFKSGHVRCTDRAVLPSPVAAKSPTTGKKLRGPAAWCERMGLDVSPGRTEPTRNALYHPLKCSANVDVGTDAREWAMQ